MERLECQYGYGNLLSDIHALLHCDPAWSREVIGYSRCGRPIIALRRGSGSYLIHASHHANEWITSAVLMRWILRRGKIFDGYAVPMVNPDGVELSVGNPQAIHAAEQRTGLKPIPTEWKANIAGVDLNLNYPAQWHTAVAIKKAAGVCGSAPRDWPGSKPLSEPETQAMVRLSARGFQRSLSLHSQGREIYWNFRNYAPSEALKLAEEMANASGYAVTEPPEISSYGGYKDWFLQEYRRPAYTVEMGYGQNPLPLSDFGKICEEVFPLLDVFCQAE